MRITSGRRRRGYTLMDVSVAMVIAVVTGAGAMFWSGTSRQMSDRSACANNLRQIALAMQMYANGEVRGQAFPRTYWDTTSTAVTVYTGMNSKNTFAPAGAPSPVGDNNVTASFYLLLKTQQITPQVFVCPSDDAVPWDLSGPNSSLQQHSDFPSRAVLSYSYACPFATANGPNSAVAKGWKFNASLGSDYPLAADMNPGGSSVLSINYASNTQQTAPANSTNHGGRGQNAVYADAHVEFQQTPFCGASRIDPSGSGAQYRDNIYTAGWSSRSPGGTAVSSVALDSADMVLLPVRGDGFQPPTRSHNKSGVPLAWIAGGVAALVLLVGLILAVSYAVRKPKAASDDPHR